MFQLLFRLLFGGLTSFLAQKRGRNPVLWFILGFFLLIFGPLLVWILPDESESQEKERKRMEDEEKGIIDVTPAPPPGEGFDGCEWYYVDSRNQQQGPVEFGEMQRLFREKQIGDNTLIWAEGMGDWKRIREYTKLRDALL